MEKLKPYMLIYEEARAVPPEAKKTIDAGR